MKQDRAASVVFFLVGVAVVLEGFRLPYFTDVTMGPGFFLRWTGGVLMLLSVILFITTRAPNRPIIEDLQGFKKAAILAASIFAYSFVLGFLGFVLGLTLFIAFVVGWLERKSWRQWVPVSAGVTLGCYLLFKMWLGVPLPRGILGI